MPVRVSKDLLIGTITTLIGIITGIIISEFFYQRNIKDIKKDLLDGAGLDILRNLDKETYPQLFDSVRFEASGQPWRQLSTQGMDQLFSNLLNFRDFENFKEFANLVNATKAALDDFNDRIELRNYSIYQGFEYVSSANPRAYHFYQSIVAPRLKRLKEYIGANYNQLISS